MMTGYWVSQALYVAAKLGVADFLVDGAQSVENLATATQTDARSLQCAPWLSCMPKNEYQAWGNVLHSVRTGEDRLRPAVWYELRWR